MKSDDAAVLLSEVKQVSATLKEFLSRLVEQQRELKALIAVLEDKGVVTAAELEKAQSEMLTPLPPARMPVLGRCRRATAHARDSD